MNQNQTTPTENEAAMLRVLEAAQKVAPPWALPLTLDDVDPTADEEGRDVYFSGRNYGEDIEGDVIVHLSLVVTFDDEGNEIERGDMEPVVHIERSRGKAFSSTDLVAMCLALSKMHDELNADEIE